MASQPGAVAVCRNPAVELGYLLDFFVGFAAVAIPAFFFAAFFDFGATDFLAGALVKCSFTLAAI